MIETTVSGNGSVCRTNTCPPSAHVGVVMQSISPVPQGRGVPYGSEVLALTRVSLASFGPTRIPDD